MTPKHIIKRVVTIGWKHRQDFDSEFNFMGPALGKKVKIELNGNETYSIETLKKLFKKEYVNNHNRLFFDNSFVNIGHSNGKICTSFEDDEGKLCNFWSLQRTCEIKAIV